MHRSSKFPSVTHHSRGSLDPAEYFVLVPDRDPAAVKALRAYAEATPDTILASELVSWCDRIEGITSPQPSTEVRDKIHAWTAVLAREVHAGRMDLETALQRIAGHVAVLVRDGDHAE